MGAIVTQLDVDYKAYRAQMQRINRKLPFKQPILSKEEFAKLYHY